MIRTMKKTKGPTSSIFAMMMPLLLVGVAAVAGGCRSDSASDDGGLATKLKNDANRGLAFATVDTNYTASTVNFYDFQTGAITPRLTGESGDPLLRWLGDKLFLFNRVNTSVNVRTLDPRTDDAATTQVATPGAQVGDPADAIVLSDGHLMLANAVAGNLTLTDASGATSLQTLASGSTDATKLAVGSAVGDKFSPTALWMRAGADGDDIFVLHQGRDNKYAYNGTQQVFVVNYRNGVLTFKDVDETTVGIQGIPLKGTNPLGLYGSNGALWVASLCSIGDDAKSCTASGIEKIDLDSFTAAVVYDLTATPHRSNGGSIIGAKDGIFYTLAATTDGSKAKYALRIDAAQAAVNQYHTFPDGANGCCGLFVDRTNGRSFVGDQSTDGRGLLTIYEDSGVQTGATITLDANPYTGAFVPK